MDNPILNGELHCNEKEIWSKMTNRQYSIMTSRELSVFFESAPDAMIHSWPQMYSKIYKMFTVHIFWLNCLTDRGGGCLFFLTMQCFPIFDDAIF